MEISFLPSPFHFVILALASYRLTKLLIEDTILNSLREKVWEKFPPESTYLGYLTTCPWCVGWWLSLVLFFCYTIVLTPTMWFCVPLAMSAIVGLLSALEHR